jgi:hypothetical protein
VTYTIEVIHHSPGPEYTELVESDNLDELAILVAWKLADGERGDGDRVRSYGIHSGDWNETKWRYVADQVFWIGHEMRNGKPAA